MTGKPSTSVVVGATGYLGGHICQKLSEELETVHAFGRRQWEVESSAPSNQIHYTGDVCDVNTIETIIGVDPDNIVYCVSLDQHESEVDIERALKVNVNALWTLANRLDQEIKKPIRFVYLSTAQAYGILNGEITEALMPRPRTAYGLTHLMCEQVLARYADRGVLEPVSVRLSNGYGPPTSDNAACWQLVMNDFCRSILEKKRIQLSSDGTPQRDFVYVGDVAKAINKLLAIPAGALMPVYNLASGNTKTVLELAMEVKNVFFERSGYDCPIVLGDGEIVVEERELVKPKVGRQFAFDVSAIRNLGLSMEVSLPVGASKLFDFLEGRNQ
jgi:UDP-glucose 4-epimerase|tara:strand:- start:621 stop:1610 length:990 start_codon:yes stop_codon:yes gene_type:complete